MKNLIYKDANKRIKHVPTTKLFPIDGRPGGFDHVDGFMKRVYKKNGPYTWKMVSEEFVAYPVEA